MSPGPAFASVHVLLVEDHSQLRKILKVALDFEEATAEGEDYTAHLYEADLRLPATVAATSLSVTPSDPSVRK